jgi:hypothetical protein
VISLHTLRSQFYEIRFPLFLASIRSPLEGDKLSIHTQSVQDGRGRYGIKDLSPVGGDEIGGDQGGSDLRSFREDLEDPIGLFFGGDHITQFIETEDRDFGIVVDETIEVSRRSGSGLFC